MQWRISPVLALLFAFVVGSSSAHPGRTDANGGHHDRKNGGYHYHGAPRSSTPSRTPSSVGSSSTTVTTAPREVAKSPQPPAPIATTPDRESFWKQAFNEAVAHGRIDVVESGEKIDILTEAHAIEVERVSNFTVGVVQARLSGRVAGKTPGLALYMDGDTDTARLYEAAKRDCEARGIAIWLINEHVSAAPAGGNGGATAPAVEVERPQARSATEATADRLVGRVVGVHDGDTLTLLVDHREVKVRLHGIDAPELRGQPHGQDAKQALSDLVFGKDVEVRVTDTDRYGRTVALVRVGRTEVNVEMVRAGWAWWYREYAKGDVALAKAENEAKEGKRGLWRESDAMPPWEWRKRRNTREGPWPWIERGSSLRQSADDRLASECKTGIEASALVNILLADRVPPFVGICCSTSTPTREKFEPTQFPNCSRNGCRRRRRGLRAAARRRNSMGRVRCGLKFTTDSGNAGVASG